MDLLTVGVDGAGEAFLLLGGELRPGVAADGERQRCHCFALQVGGRLEPAFFGCEAVDGSRDVIDGVDGFIAGTRCLEFVELLLG